MGLDLANQLKRMTIAGATGVPQTLGAANADPTANQGGGDGTVPGALAAVAQPPGPPPGPAPGTFGAANPTVNYSPYARLLAGSYAADPGMANIAAGINLGRTATLGPGSDYGTQTDVAKARAMPVTVSSGTTRIQDPTQPVTAPGNAIQGPSNYDTTASGAAATADQGEARNDSSIGAASATNLATLQQLDQLYDQVVAPGANVPGLAQELAVRKLADSVGVDLTRFSSVEEAKNEIKGRLSGMLGSARQAQGNPALRGGFDAIMAQLPNADMSPERYHSMSQAFATSLQRQIADGQAADTFLGAPSAQAANARRNAIAANRAAEAAALAAHGYKTDAGVNPPDGSASTPAPAPPDQPPLRPATAQELVFARNAINSGRSKADVIAHARQKGFDLGPNF